MDAASEPPNPPSQTPQELPPAGSLPPLGPATPFLETLFSGKARRFQSLGSLLYGIVGVLVYALAVSAIAGLILGALHEQDTILSNYPSVKFSCVILLVALTYPSAILTLQLFASCQFPFTIRLAFVYASLYALLRAVTFRFPEPIDGVVVLICAPICAGGFFQHRIAGWNAVAWGQRAKPASKISIASLLDVTAAVAITMGIASTSQIDPRGLLCLVPGCLILAIVGMPGWGRLTALCNRRKHRDMGLTLWMVGNAIAGCVVFLVLVMSNPGTDATSLQGFVVGPAVVVLAHAVTAIPLAWLRVCGWRFVQAEPESDQTAQTIRTFNSSI